MILDWFNAREAIEAGSALAEQFAARLVHGSAASKDVAKLLVTDVAVQDILRHADRVVRPLQLNLFKRAKLANSFKWKLLEHGVQKERADKVTQTLLLHLSLKKETESTRDDFSSQNGRRPEFRDGPYLLSQGNKFFAQGSYADSAASYEELIKMFPRRHDALNNLGAALCKIGRYVEATARFRQALEIVPGNAESHYNLGNVLRWTGQITESERFLRRAIKLQPNYTDARASLGLTLVLLGRLGDAKTRFQKVLKADPVHVDALLGMAQVAGAEGKFDESAAIYKRVLKINPNMPNALAASTSIRKMTLSDSAWLETAKVVADSNVSPLEEANLRFAIGKYSDDVEKYDEAFRSYKRGNELLRATAEKYDRDARTLFVDDVIRAYPGERLLRASPGSSSSIRPVLVVGMMRSGTSLTEQIISSHPLVEGAGELAFWGDSVRKQEVVMRQDVLSEEVTMKLAAAYLAALGEGFGDVQRIVDKAPVNSDHLGLVHTVFPNAQIIYMQRDPIDTCLSCYFQQFSTALNFTMDLGDLAHYYREHHRLVAHWRTVLPPHTMLEVPYEGLVADQTGWTRRIIEFLGLEWDDRCLDFHKTQRSVITASGWQVRQKIYAASVQRWRNYQKFLGPLLELKNLSGT